MFVNGLVFSSQGEGSGCVCEWARVLLIGLTGGSASGKTTVAQKIIEALEVPWVALLSMDSFYKVLTEEQHHKAAESDYNFDHPGLSHPHLHIPPSPPHTTLTSTFYPHYPCRCI